jgi:putative hydrolase of the HAD superfamily
MKATNTLTTIGFDADDTLWQNQQFYDFTEIEFANLLSDHGDHAQISSHLLEVERRNLQFYGFGIKGFTLSMIDTALEVTGGNVSSKTIADILALGKEMTVHPVETLPHVHDTLEALAGRYKIILITKGDLFDQERKLAASGLGDFFNAVEIVSDKKPHIYERIFARHGEGAKHAMMIGNSMKSDVIPALEAGSWGVFVPHERSWAMEHADAPTAHPRFREVETLKHVPDLLQTIDQ